MITLTATIGRNRRQSSEVAPGKPLADVLWQLFQDSVRDTLVNRAKGEHWTEVHYGVGIWDGVAEESAKVTVIAEDADIDGIHDLLAVTAKLFDQDAIAFSAAPSELIYARD